jgi:2-keto-4-pentenoate hydratase/2-oxohepta-3-ene-1,7-dioic acid hydratase in catechol pathway
MKIVRYIDTKGQRGTGRLVEPDRAIPMHGDLFGEHTFTGEPVTIARFLPPVEPPNVFAIGLNYRKHAEEGGVKRMPEEPLVFIKATTAVIGHGEPIVLPHSAPDEVDYEAELAIVIGRRAKNVGEEEAASVILGYTCANDVSARDCQKVRDKQWARAKSFDTFCPLGPVLVTPDEIDADGAAIRSILNGRVMQDSNTSDLIFSIRRLVSHLSHQFTLLPGTVILTGTPEGVGFVRQPPVYLRPGDTIEIEIEGIGRLSNSVVADTTSS